MVDTSHLVLTQQDGVTVVGFVEPSILDAYHVDKIAKQLYELIEKHKHQMLVLDFSTIKMLSSQTFSVLLKMRQLLDKVDGKMVISGINPGLYRVFKITNLQSIFKFFEDNDSAVNYLKQQ